MRTIPNIDHLSSPVVGCIYERLLPTIFGCQLSPDLQDIFALPTRLRGMGIGNVKEELAQEYASLRLLSTPLADLIVQQRIDKLPKEEDLNSETRELKHERKNDHGRLQPSMKNALEIAAEKGALKWLTVLPLEDKRYVQHREAFRDAISMQCDLPLEDLPSRCPCKHTFSSVHAMKCKKEVSFI